MLAGFLQQRWMSNRRGRLREPLSHVNEGRVARYPGQDQGLGRLLPTLVHNTIELELIVFK
jgi:hypothetical protein